MVVSIQFSGSIRPASPGSELDTLQVGESSNIPMQDDLRFTLPQVELKQKWKKLVQKES